MALGDIISAGGQAFQDLFGSQGAAAEANSYKGAALLARQNAQLSSASTRIQDTQLARQIFQTEGTQVADVAGAGFTESGSALDLLRSSAQQGALAKSLTNIQGAINENSYAAQAGAYEGAAAAAGENANANTIGAIASLGGAILNNTGALASAGKTVVTGAKDVYNGIFGISSAGTTDSITNPLDLSTSDITGLASPLDVSSLDNSIGSVAGLGDNFSSEFQTVDTSDIPIGTSASDVSTDISNVLDSPSSDFGFGDIFNIGGDISDAVGGGVLGDVLGGVGDVVTGALSVICTACFKRNYISRRVWYGCQIYGAQLEVTTYNGYYFWGKYIARLIDTSDFWAQILMPIFRPVLNVMAEKMGINVKSGIHGYIMFIMMFAASWLVGKILWLKEEYKNAATGTY